MVLKCRLFSGRVHVARILDATQVMIAIQITKVKDVILVRGSGFLGPLFNMVNGCEWFKIVILQIPLLALAQ